MASLRWTDEPFPEECEHVGIELAVERHPVEACRIDAKFGLRLDQRRWTEKESKMSGIRNHTIVVMRPKICV
jgi:hypothetical protein